MKYIQYVKKYFLVQVEIRGQSSLDMVGEIFAFEIVNNNQIFAAVLMTMTCHFLILASVIEKVAIFVDICIISFLFEILPLLMLFNPADCIANSS